MALTQDHSAITVGRALKGDAVIRDVVLTGWSQGLDAVSQSGKAFWSVTAGNVLQLYADDERATLVASGTIVSGSVALSAVGGSGLSGSARVAHTVASEGVLIISFADETDLTRVFQSLEGYLDSSDQWAGGVRYEQAFFDAKVMLDSMVDTRFGNRLPVKPDGTRDLTAFVIDRTLRLVHAKLVAYVLETWRGSLDPVQIGVAQEHRRNAERLFTGVSLTLNVDSNDSADGVSVSARATRG